MMEEDYVLILSGNRNFVDLVLTFNLKIDFNGNTNQIEAVNQRDTGSDSNILPCADRQDTRQDEEERIGGAETDGSVSVEKVQDGHAGGDSKGDRGNPLCYRLAFTQDG